MHNFADASTFEYGQCFYLRVKDEDENENVSQVTEKSPVAPLKITTMPRLDLTAAAASATRTTRNILNTVLNDFKGRLDTFFTSHLFI